MEGSSNREVLSAPPPATTRKLLRRLARWTCLAIMLAVTCFSTASRTGYFRQVVNVRGVARSARMNVSADAAENTANPVARIERARVVAVATVAKPVRRAHDDTAPGYSPFLPSHPLRSPPVRA